MTRIASIVFVATMILGGFSVISTSADEVTTHSVTSTDTAGSESDVSDVSVSARLVQLDSAILNIAISTEQDGIVIRLGELISIRATNSMDEPLEITYQWLGMEQNIWSTILSADFGDTKVSTTNLKSMDFGVSPYPESDADKKTDSRLATGKATISPKGYIVGGKTVPHRDEGFRSNRDQPQKTVPSKTQKIKVAGKDSVPQKASTSTAEVTVKEADDAGSKKDNDPDNNSDDNQIDGTGTPDGTGTTNKSSDDNETDIKDTKDEDDTEDNQSDDSDNDKSDDGDSENENKTKLSAALTATTGNQGKGGAKFKSKSDDGTTERVFKLKVSGVMTNGTLVTGTQDVIVGGVLVGSVSLTNGSGKLKLATDADDDDTPLPSNFPTTIDSTTTVAVGPVNTPILTGTFATSTKSERSEDRNHDD